MKEDSEHEETGDPGPDNQRIEALETAGGSDTEAPKDIQQQIESHEAEQ